MRRISFDLELYRNQMLALIGLIWQPVDWMYQLGMILLYLATWLTLWSMLAYLRAAWADLNQ